MFRLKEPTSGIEIQEFVKHDRVLFDLVNTDRKT